MESSSEPDKIKNGEIYAAMIQLIIHAENISWNRFNNFFVVTTILMAAWGALFASSLGQEFSTKIVQSVLGTVGVITSLIWYSVGSNSRLYLNKYLAQGERMEKRAAMKGDVPLILTCEIRDEIKNQRGWAGQFRKIGTSSFVQKAVPIAFVVLYLVMLGATWWCQISAWWYHVPICF